MYHMLIAAERSKTVWNSSMNFYLLVFLKLMLEGGRMWEEPWIRNLPGTIRFHHVEYLHLFERLDKTVGMHEESLVRGHKSKRLAAKSVTMLYMLYLICHANPTKLQGLVFHFAVLAQPAWSGRTTVLTGQATSETREIPQAPVLLTVLSKPITDWLLLGILHSCVLALRYIAINTEALVTRVSTMPPSQRTLDQNFLSTFWSSSKRCLLPRICDIWGGTTCTKQESPKPRHPTASSNIPTCPTCIGPASLKQVLPAWTLLSHPALCGPQAQSVQREEIRPRPMPNEALMVQDILKAHPQTLHRQHRPDHQGSHPSCALALVEAEANQK